MSAALSVWVSGVGLWAPGAPTWDAFRDVVGGVASPGVSERPVADVLPPNERRRAPESVLLAAAAAGQAVRMSGRDAATPALDTLEAALLDTGRPLLLTPLGVPAAPPEIVVIAWKDAPAAARAVAAAMPFIEQAKRVVILSVSEDAETPDTSGERLARALHWHNPRIERRLLTATGQPAP